ncbi:MAG: right-handed parallel beta-helix repeat-containing protein [Candidatus Omnitrophica bacterium]|nr:right-handed parallel beta-helix repeat-containing protein [Candidatus Omnitrophota bacterium]
MKAVALLPALLLVISPAVSAPYEFFISPSGNDAWSGKISSPYPARTNGPFATLARARDEVRQLQSDPTARKGERLLWLMGGEHFLAEAVVFGASESGSEDSPIRIKSHPGQRAILTGAKRISGFRETTDPSVLDRLPEEARGQVLETNLKEQGITDYGELKSRGFGQPIHPAGLELFFNDEPMTLARWPNEGWVKIADVPDGATSGKFLYEGDRPERWKSATDPWIHGYWTWDWADSYVKVGAIDTAKKEIATVEPHGVYGYKKGKRFRALNLLEEIDQAGEWYLERSTGTLYFWPPSPIEAGEAFVSLTEKLLVLENAAHISIEKVTLQGNRGTAVTVTDGDHVRLAGCAFKNIGNSAASFSGGSNHTITSCDVWNTGDGGFSINSGDRKTLTPGNSEVVNNHIHHYSRWCPTYRPAVSVSGVGDRVAHNLIHDGPHNAIMLHGNEHLIELNEIHHVCQDTGDVGAFYMGRDWTQRGNIVRFNLFHHLGGLSGVEGFIEAMAVYLDDWSSGTTVYGNLCYKAGRAVLIGGGRDNLVENNVFVECTPSVHVDSRGLGWAKNYFSGETTTLTDRLADMNYKEPPYSERYPELLTLYEDEPALAKGNKILRNISFGGRWLDLLDGLTDKVVDLRDNWTEGDPGFVDIEALDFHLKPNAPALSTGFKPLPLEKIGLFADSYRNSLPEQGLKR